MLTLGRSVCVNKKQGRVHRNRLVFLHRSEADGTVRRCHETSEVLSLIFVSLSRKPYGVHKTH